MSMARPQVPVKKWPFSAIPASIGIIACAAHNNMPPRNSTDFLELAEDCTFLDWELICAFNEQMGISSFSDITALSRNSPPTSGQVGVNHAVK
jgi:hypothetical protein